MYIYIGRYKIHQWFFIMIIDLRIEHFLITIYQKIIYFFNYNLIFWKNQNWPIFSSSKILCNKFEEVLIYYLGNAKRASIFTCGIIFQNCIRFIFVGKGSRSPEIFVWNITKSCDFCKKKIVRLFLCFELYMQSTYVLTLNINFEN